MNKAIAQLKLALEKDIVASGLPYSVLASIVEVYALRLAALAQAELAKEQKEEKLNDGLHTERKDENAQKEALGA